MDNDYLLFQSQKVYLAMDVLGRGIGENNCWEKSLVYDFQRVGVANGEARFL